MARDDPFPGSPEQWAWVLNTLGANRWNWSHRHGLSLLRHNPDYWNFLIPGVGLAPVVEYCLLITAFVLVIGPLNYWVLRRRKRLYLLVITIPVGAALVTVMLFGYALIADGFGTRVRVRSLTYIDQSRDQAVCWSRLSYYAGMTPSAGLTLPEDVALIPILELPESSPYRSSSRPPQRELIWRDEQWLASGWLVARTPTQYLTVRSRKTQLGLGRIASDDESQVIVRNRLGASLNCLLVAAEDGKLHWADEVAEDETITMTPIARIDARKAIRERLVVGQPSMPVGVSNRTAGPYGGPRRMRVYRPAFSNSRDFTPRQSTSRLETPLRELIEPGTGNRPLLPPGSYVAIVDRSPEVEVGLPNVNEQAGYHVMMGNW